MKRQLLIGSVLLAAISALSQTGRIKPSGMINTRIMAETKFSDNKFANQAVSPPVAEINDEPESSTGASRAAVTNTWENFTSSMNIYGMLISFCKPLQWNDELNAVSFVHRKSPTYAPAPFPISTAENGSIVGMISGDCGATWDSTAMYVNDNFWGRYPGGAIYNPPSTPTNTDMNNAYIVGAGPTTGAGNVTWIGNWYASKQLGLINYDNVPSTAVGAQQAIPTLGPFPTGMTRHDFAAYAFSATDDGKMRVLAGVTDDALNPVSDTAIALVTGRFNNGVFDWTDSVFHVPSTKASDVSRNFVSRPIMAWNEEGTIGYIVVMGSRKDADSSNVGYQPIVYTTTNSGTSWTLDQVGINFNGTLTPFANVKRSISTVNSNTNIEVPFFNWIEGYDCIVDANNKLHIFSTILGHASDHPDSLDFISQFTTERFKWPHQPGSRAYLYDFMFDGNTNTWSHMTVDTMYTEGLGEETADAGYGNNEWDADPSENNRKVRVNARLQLSRTPDGKYIVYTWSESDTNSVTGAVGRKNWNQFPDVKARVLNVTTGNLHPTKLNITGTAPGEIKKRAHCHFISPKCRLASWTTANGPVLSMPVTVSNSNPLSQLTRNKHWFSWAILNFGNVPDAKITLCGALPDTSTIGIAENSFNSAANSYVFPNPAKNNAIVSVNLLHSSKVQIEVLNTVGQVVRVTRSEGQNGKNNIPVDLNGLASGIYMVSIKVDDASSTKKLVVE